MKKHLLLGAALLSFGFASAQTVQNIPNAEALRIHPDYFNVHVETMPDDGSAPKDRYKVGDDGVEQTDNMNSGDWMEFKVRSTETSKYVVRFQTGTKLEGTILTWRLFDAAGDEVWTSEFGVAYNGEWNAKWLDTMTFVEEDLPAGDYTLHMDFWHELGKNTVNVRNIIFEAREEITNYALWTYIEPADGGNSLTISPNQPAYLEGDAVTITAVAQPGYKFNHFEYFGDEYTDNPLTIYMTEEIDLTAYFDELVMSSQLPGSIDLNTVLIGGVTTEIKACSLDGSSYNEGVPVQYLCNYRHGGSEEFDINVTKSGTYEMIAPMASKQDGATVTYAFYDYDSYYGDPFVEPEAEVTLVSDNTGNWQKFTTKGSDVALTEGHKIMKLSFNEPVAAKYTANILFIKFGLDGDFGDSDGIENVNADALAVPVRAYNLQGIEVSPDTKGLIIIGNQKVFNK